MKKLLILAAAAIALVACSRTFETHKVEGQAIGFGTWANVLTKHTQGLSTGDTGFAWEDNDNFKVVGYKTNSDASTTTIFDNVTVTYTLATTSWAYTTPRYWDYNATNYVFHAVSPAATANLVVATGHTSAASSAVTFTGDDSDILVADETTVTTYGNDVNMAFNHIASLVDLKVKKDTQLDATQVDITGISITGMGNTGTFTIDGYTSNKPNVTWSTPSSYTGTYTNTSGVTQVTTLPTDIASNTASDLITKLIVLPQTFNNSTNIQKIVISYTITDKNGTPNVTNDDIVSTYDNKELALYLFDDVDNRNNNDTPIGSFDAGKHYIFTLTINAKLITFTASVNGWDTPDVQGFGYLVE